MLIPKSYLETNPDFNTDPNKYYDGEISEVIPYNDD